MKTYFVVVVLAVAVYWFKDSVTDYYFSSPNDAHPTAESQPESTEKTRVDGVPFKDRSHKEMSKFIKPTFKPKVEVDKTELKKKLSPIEYHVTQEKGTERPFTGKYLRLNDNGWYTCVVCNEELFSSDHKFDSGCGWPAFHSIGNISKVRLTPDYSHNQLRTEVQCATCGAHLGHVFQEEESPTKTRFCINSASLRFIKEGKEDTNNNDASKEDKEKN